MLLSLSLSLFSLSFSPSHQPHTPKHRILILAALFSLGLLLQLLGCVLWNNWWPMLTLIIYVIVPVPWLIFGSGSDSRWSSGNEETFMDAGKFLSGFAATASIGIPCILYHAGVIAWGALWFELSAALVLGLTCVLYDHFASRASEMAY